MGNEPNNGMENRGLTKIAKYSVGANYLTEISVTDRKTYLSSTTPQQQEICQYANNFRKIILYIECKPHPPSLAIFCSKVDLKVRILLHIELRAEFQPRSSKLCI